LIESDPNLLNYIVTLLSTTDLPNQPSLEGGGGLAWRLLSASEVLLGAATIVIGHNVFFTSVPNEVPILFVLGLVSGPHPRWADGRRSDFKNGRPEIMAFVLIWIAPGGGSGASNRAG